MLEVTLTHIDAPNATFLLAKPLGLSLCYNGVDWVHSYPGTDLYGYGLTREDSLNQFIYEFQLCWDIIVQTPDEELSEDCLALKHQLIFLVSEITYKEPL